MKPPIIEPDILAILAFRSNSRRNILKKLYSPHHPQFEHKMAKFTVDTHLFRELGELLVGRDSTALIELIKNAYDADATKVTVEGEHLDDAANGRILIWDNGIGMTLQVFESGFLRIASRHKETGERKSMLYSRRYTGQKGIGRLAAHKLARRMTINSTPNPTVYGRRSRGIDATVDWSLIEQFETIDAIDSTALHVTSQSGASTENAGTLIELSKLRRNWTPSERSRFFLEVQTFLPPSILLDVPKSLFMNDLLIGRIKASDAKRSDPGFEVELLGDLESGEEYWQTLTEAASWLIEINALQKKTVEYLISPTQRMVKDSPKARSHHYTFEYPGSKDGPHFQARILVRTGALRGKKNQQRWLGQMAGVRVYLEGFRVLPYGESSDDWLELNSDYRRRDRTLRFLEEYEIEGEKPVTDEGLSILGNDSYFGAVFLTQADAGHLRVLVNREGFIPDASFDMMKQIVRVGVDLSVRANAAARSASRAERREKRASGHVDNRLSTQSLKQQVEFSVQRAQSLAKEARQAATAGQFQRAARLVNKAAAEFQSGSDTSDRLLTEPSVTRILAAVGTQMASFVHEMNALLGMAQSIEDSINRLRTESDLTKDARLQLGRLASSMGDLRRVVERQAAYLADITAPDARRRRSRLDIQKRAAAAMKLIQPAADRASIEIQNLIPEDLRSPPMFPAELTLIFSNLLTNAAKAAGKNGKIRLTGRESDGGLILRIENTGRKVDLREAHRWFRPFESTTEVADPYLGQGMGMGLPITRNILEEYGAEIRFTQPRPGFATALVITFP